MRHPGRLELEITDASGARLTETVTIDLRHQVLHEQRRAESVDASKIVVIEDLRTEPQGLYIMRIEAPSYHPVQWFVTIPSTGVRREKVPLPIRADRARAVFPEYDVLDERVRGVLERSAKVLGHEGLTGKELYNALDDKPKAGLLNIAKKSLATQFKNGSDLLPHIALLKAVGDRCFVAVSSALLDQMPALVDGRFFHQVNGSLHQPPEPDLMAAGSFKTEDAFGNLQLTFFKSASRCVADVDIDDAGGLAHVFQVVRNHVTGDPTHPYNIHQILLLHQRLDPGYRLLPKG
jgi:hypothetical protein